MVEPSIAICEPGELGSAGWKQIVTHNGGVAQQGNATEEFFGFADVFKNAAADDVIVWFADGGINSGVEIAEDDVGGAFDDVTGLVSASGFQILFEGLRAAADVEDGAAGGNKAGDDFVAFVPRGGAGGGDLLPEAFFGGNQEGDQGGLVDFQPIQEPVFFVPKAMEDFFQSRNYLAIFALVAAWISRNTSSNDLVMSQAG